MKIHNFWTLIPFQSQNVHVYRVSNLSNLHLLTFITLKQQNGFAVGCQQISLHSKHIQEVGWEISLSNWIHWMKEMLHVI